MGYCFFGKWKWSRLKIILCFIFYKNETTVVPKKSLEKLEISIVKREAAGKFVVEMMFSGEIYDKAFYQMILGKKLPRTKRRFWSSCCRIKTIYFTKSFIPNHKALNAEKKVAITLYCLKDTPPQLVLLSIVLELLFVQLSSLSHLKFFPLKFEVDSLAVAAASMAYSFAQWWRVIDFIDGSHYYLNSNVLHIRTSIKIYFGRRAEVFTWISVHSAYRNLAFERRDLDKQASPIDHINTKWN